MPIPVWLRDKGLAISWANQVFLASTGAATIETARSNGSTLDKSERDLAATARSQNTVLEAKRFAQLGGARRAITFTEIPMGDAGIIGTAVDMTDVAAAEAKLQQHLDAHVDTLDKLATAVAIFSREQKLTFFNRAFVKLWGLPREWLEPIPSDGEILDRPTRSPGSFPNSAIIRRGSADAWRCIRPKAAISRSSGTFPAARPCGWQASPIPSAASPSFTKM